ncbi:MAG: ABC transporter ATP-binding protein [Fidelibacterota bacterium]
MSAPIIEINNVTKSFGKRIAVNDLSLTVPEGSIFGFLGPNGSGKSTTIRVMTGLIRPDYGEVRIRGRSVQKEGNQALVGVGSLIERADFYKHLSARTNLEMLARMDGIGFSRITTVLKRVSLEDRALDRVKHYSQGMRQRLGIAQALLSNPGLLILDEPTNGLDPQGMKDVRDLIRGLSAEGITIFLSSHLLDEVQKICSHVGIIHQGKLITVGLLEDLLADTELFTTEIRAYPLEKAFEVLHNLTWIQQCRLNNDSIVVSVDREQLAAVVQVLVEHNLKVEEVVPRMNLEDVFLHKTGDQS